MAGKNKYDVPSDAELIELYEQHGTVADVARSFDPPIPRNTVQHWYESAEGRLGRKITNPKPLMRKDAVPANVGESVSREELLEAQLKEAQVALRKARKVEVQEERLYEMVSKAIATTPSLLPKVKPPKAVKSEVANTLLAPFSDTHAGEIVDLEAMDGINEYNWSIMEQRVAAWVEAIISHKQHYTDPIQRLVIAGLGDMLSGANHEELEITNEFPIAEQCWKFSHTFAEAICRLAEHFEHIDVYGVPGNHPRMKKQPANKQVFNNFDWLMYEETALRTAKEGLTNVTHHTTKAGQQIIQIAGKNIFAWHGDGIRSSMPGVPWGGVMRRVNEIKKDYANRGVLLDYFLLGHFHQANAVQNIWMNGSVKGSDEYVKKQFGSGESPRQLLINFSETHARVTGVHYIDL